jgi:hypothetical protein
LAMPTKRETEISEWCITFYLINKCVNSFLSTWFIFSNITELFIWLMKCDITSYDVGMTQYYCSHDLRVRNSQAYLLRNCLNIFSNGQRGGLKIKIHCWITDKQ